MTKNIAIEWVNAPAEGRIEIKNGKFVSGNVDLVNGSFSGNNFSCESSGRCRMEIIVDADNMGVGAAPTMVSICSSTSPFTFFLRDVREDYPILIPDYSVAVTMSTDKRSYSQIETAIRKRGIITNYQRIDMEPEETFEEAAANTRELKHPVWLGIGRDVRVFETGLRQPMLHTDWVQPRFHGNAYFWPEREKYTSCRYGFVAGRGWECTENTRRWLDEGFLPIFHTERIDDDLRYEQTSFVTLEKTTLTSEAVRGTHYLVGDGLSACHVFNDEQEKAFEALLDQELDQEEETVFCCHIVATNTASVPRYAYFKAVYPHFSSGLIPGGDPAPHTFDGKNGFGMHKDSDLVYGVSRLNGKPMPQEEIAVLLVPGESAVYEFFLPHRPVSSDRAAMLAEKNMLDCMDECRRYWKKKYENTGRLDLPEQRVNDMVKAGLIHLDLVAYGIEPNGTIAMSDGAYGPVCSEVWVIINYFDSMGLHDIARRSLTYYLEKMHESGFMQNFSGYEIENGAVLLALGEHYRYTRDDDWVREITPKVLKCVDFMLDWRKRNKREDLRGNGYGLLNGQVADPIDPERSFMLNAYGYAGLSRAAEMLAVTHPQRAKKLTTELELYKTDIATAFHEAMARGPVVPLGNGTWSPTAPPWVGPNGPVSLFTENRCFWTHGSMTVRDDIIGPIHLVSLGIIDVNEQVATFLLDYQNEQMYSRNLASSQPYYSRHSIVHLQRGETKRFLKAFYNGFASLADREIYSFWEHYYHESPHKTHESAQFLMQARCMLYLEDGDTLQLLRGIPRLWLENSKRIELDNVVSYFGPLSLKVESRLDAGVIEAEVTCSSDRKPASIELRLPHPYGMRAISVEGGQYNRETESVTVDTFNGHAKIRVFFPFRT